MPCRLGHDRGVSRGGRCKECHRLSNAQYRERHPEKERESCRRWRKNNPGSDLKKLYGITLEQKQEQYASQEGKCAVCKCILETLSKSCVDHDHKTGQVRGLLCHNCNMAFGLLAESDVVISALLEYAKYWASKKAELLED